MKYDLIIVGSGSVGAAAGYYATRAGLNVLMTDAWLPPHQHGSHHGDTRLIRHAYGEGEKYVPLVLRAQSLWDELAADSGEAVFERTGVINLGPADSAFLANVAQSAREFNLDVERLDAAALMARWPEIRVPEGYIGLFESQSGFLRSELAVKPGSASPVKRAAPSCLTARLPLSIIMMTASPLTPPTVSTAARSCW